MVICSIVDGWGSGMKTLLCSAYIVGSYSIASKGSRVDTL